MSQPKNDPAMVWRVEFADDRPDVLLTTSDAMKIAVLHDGGPVVMDPDELKEMGWNVGYC